MSRNSGEHTLDIGVIDNGDNKVGDVVHATVIDPILDHGDQRNVDVIVNIGLARIEVGAAAIGMVHVPAGGRLTAAQAHQLSVDLNTAADTIASIRAQLGYDT